MVRLLVEREVQRDEIRFAEELLQADPATAERRDVRSGDVRIADDKIHFERARPQRDPRADVAHADDAEGLAGELGADQARPIGPAVRLHGVVGSWGVTRQGDHLAERELRYSDGIHAGHVGHPDVVLAGCIDIDARDVHADTGARHDLQAAAALLDMAARDAPFAADHCIDARRLLFPALGLGPWIHHDDFGALAKPCDQFRIEFLNEDAAERHGAILEPGHPGTTGMPLAAREA